MATQKSWDDIVALYDGLETVAFGSLTVRWRSRLTVVASAPRWAVGFVGRPTGASKSSRPRRSRCCLIDNLIV